MYKLSSSLYKNFSFEDYVGEIVSEVSQTLIPLTVSAVKPVYGYGRVKYLYIPEENTFIFWTPIVPNIEANDYEYYMVAIKVLDEIDRETYEEEARRLFSKYFDLKTCDSGSIFVISQKLKDTHICRLKHFGKKAYLKWMNLVKGGSIRVRAFPIVAKTPEKAIHRIFKFMYIFLSKRMHALAEKVGISPKLYDYNPMKLYSLITNNITVNRELVRKFIVYMCKVVDAIHEKLTGIVKSIKVKASIIAELKSLGVPAEKLYAYIYQPLKAIVKIALNWRGMLKAETNEETFNYGLKLLSLLKHGKYRIVEKPIDNGYIHMPRIKLWATNQN
jgi:hypothetical protein